MVNNFQMKLIFIYGPPAVGKLTVAKELSRKTGYKIFHNHHTLDLAESIFTWGSEEFWKLVRKLRLDVIEAIAESEKGGVIFTFVYNGSHEEKKFIDHLESVVKKQNGVVYYVNLVAQKNVLKSRVKNSSRRKFSKISSVATLEKALKKISEKGLKKKKHLLIDNTKLSISKTARLISDFIKSS
jgi:tRNA uridine 5-carbamoylmethylation protein Kti12